MKHVTVLECSEVSLESIDFSNCNFATESYWQDFKKFIGFDDETKTKKRLKELESCVKDLRSIKAKISSSNKNDTISANLVKAIRYLPVQGKTGAQIGKSLTQHRQQYEKCLTKVEHIKTKEELQEVKDKLKELSSEKYELPEKLAFNRSDLLHFCDELIQITEIEMEIIKKGLKFKTNNVSTESYVETIEAVALESIFSKIGAVLLGIVGLWMAIQTFQLALVTFVILASGIWSFALAAGLFTVMAGFGTKFLFELATKFWKQED